MRRTRLKDDGDGNRVAGGDGVEEDRERLQRGIKLLRNVGRGSIHLHLRPSVSNRGGTHNTNRVGVRTLSMLGRSMPAGTGISSITAVNSSLGARYTFSFTARPRCPGLDAAAEGEGRTVTVVSGQEALRRPRDELDEPTRSPNAMRASTSAHAA